MKKKSFVLILILSAVVSFTAFLLTRQKLTPLSQAIKGTKPVILDIWVDELASRRSDLFEPGAEVNMLVRKRPHGKLKIITSRCVPLVMADYYSKRLALPVLEPPSEEPFNEPYVWQCRLTVKDDAAMLTSEGILSRGNQLKIGTQIALEGVSYFVDGYIVDIKS